MLKMSAPYTELAKPLDHFAVLCRGCLADSGEMKNMYEWGLAETFTIVTDVQLQRSDRIPVLLCTECEDLLAKCQDFRTQCQMSDNVLKDAAKTSIANPVQTLTEPIPAVEDIQENLVSSLTSAKKIVFLIVAPDTVSKIYLPCMYCTEKYIKQKDFLVHLRKSHQIDTEDYAVELKYFCHVSSCQYFVHSGKDKYFTGRKNLNQHHIKVHKNRVLQCCQCGQSFATESSLDAHSRTCNLTYACQVCDVSYKTNERLMVHLLRKHPDVHERYKKERSVTRTLKRKFGPTNTVTSETKRKTFEIDGWDSPKRTLATQTNPDASANIKNDVTLPSWQTAKTDFPTNEISTSTQTDIFDDLLSLKSQNSEDESSIFFSETVSLSDIQTQTFPLEFGLSRSNKHTLTSETQSPDLSIKETQTCVCLYDSPKLNINRFFDSVSSSPSSNLTSTETQTLDFKSNVKSDVMLSFNSAETQTNFDDSLHKSL